jgi:hypothetical protein
MSSRNKINSWELSSVLDTPDVKNTRTKTETNTHM